MSLLHHLLANAYSLNANSVGIPSSNGSIGQGITKVVRTLMILIGMLSVVMVIVGGLQITLAAGNPARFKQGRETIIYALVGIVVAIGGYAIVSFIGSMI